MSWKREPRLAVENQIFHCIHQETSKFQGLLGSNSPEALFKAADSLVDYKASKLRLKASMSGVGIFCANGWQVCCSVASKISRSQERCCDGNVTLGHRAGRSGIGWSHHRRSGHPSLHSVRPKRPRSREDRDLPAIQLPSTKWVPMLVTASVGSNHSN